MGFLSIAKLIARIFGKPSDLIAFIIALGVAYFLASFLPAGPWANYAFMLVAYHIFLTWLVVDAEHQSGLSLPIVQAILTHLSYLVLIVAISSVGLHIHFAIIMVLITAGVVMLARAECNSLFKTSTANKKKAVPVSKQEAQKKADAIASAVSAAATIDDYQDWLKYLAQPNRPPRKPGMSVQDEYKQWLLARARARVAPPKQ